MGSLQIPLCEQVFHPPPLALVGEETSAPVARLAAAHRLMLLAVLAAESLVAAPMAPKLATMAGHTEIEAVTVRSFEPPAE